VRIEKSLRRVRLIHAFLGVGLVATGVAGVVLSGSVPSTAAILLFVAAGLVVAVLPGLIVAGSLYHPLQRLHDAIAQSASDGDLSRRVEAPTGSAVAPVAAAYNSMMSGYQGVAPALFSTPASSAVRRPN